MKKLYVRKWANKWHPRKFLMPTFFSFFSLATGQHNLFWGCREQSCAEFLQRWERWLNHCETIVNIWQLYKICGKCRTSNQTLAFVQAFYLKRKKIFGNGSWHSLCFVIYVSAMTNLVCCSHSKHLLKAVKMWTTSFSKPERCSNMSCLPCLCVHVNSSQRGPTMKAHLVSTAPRLPGLPSTWSEMTTAHSSALTSTAQTSTSPAGRALSLTSEWSPLTGTPLTHRSVCYTVYHFYTTCAYI